MLFIKIKKFSLKDKLILKNIDFELTKGKNLAIIGESGCGKSTLLKIIYGLYDCDYGSLFWNNIQILGPKFNLVPGMSFVKYLAQDFDLMPYISVGENVGKFLSNFYPVEKENRINELLELVEMSEYKNTKAKLLSGGQMQRVALARVLAQEPEILLLDEPFSHIDNYRKNILRRKIFKYLKDKQVTTIIASHDINDSLSFSDEIIVLKNKSILEKGTPKELFKNPKNTYTASLFDDVNEININGNLFLLYPNQIELVDKSEYCAQIITSYFKGKFYLIEAKMENQILYFENICSIPENKNVFLKFK